MRNERVWEWLLSYVMPLVLADRDLLAGQVVTARELGERLFGNRPMHEATNVCVAAFEHLIEQGTLKPARCPHGLLRVLEPCDECGHAVVSVSPCGKSKRPTPEVRKHIWSVLLAHPDGLTRSELAAIADVNESPVCWAIKDWKAQGKVIVTPEKRKTRAGGKGHVIVAVTGARVK